uniref:Uncharacterized protein n=1 Tax=Nelumbo nucifera TaxID=4432 RepID=A0A822YI35_NELNU|nr:TPA_asm: hypothetical protein HUJ06_030576 [Nelumbo nucifera]
MVCAAPGPSVLDIPPKTFLLNPVTFKGPCNSTNVQVQISGNIVAPVDASAWNKDADKGHWILFDSINGLVISGSGEINGQGSYWWNCRSDVNFSKCSSTPDAALEVRSCNNSQLKGLNFVDSPRMHVVFNHCVNVQISQITATAPKDSPNTDGIHIAGCQYVEVMNSIIQTGDDCISIETGSSNIYINGVKCGPGHGISVGSLGDSGEEDSVEQVVVSNCNFNGSMNGVRIKTWQGGSGYARGIKFQNINVNNVDHPIVIDQYYCGGNHCKNETSAVKVSNVSFINIHGTSTREDAISLACSQTVACTDILLENIQLTTLVPGKNATSYCLNAHGTAKASVEPPVSCLD